MAMRDRNLTFNGVDLRDTYGLIYSSFEEDMPEPKVIKVSIPAGLDLDITDSLGTIGMTNGRHVLKFLVYGETEADRLEVKRALMALLHGRRAAYELSWDEGYSYTGRAKLSFAHKTENADLITIDIDRSPWKTSTALETVELVCGPTATYVLTGSVRYHDIKAKLLQSGSTKIGSASAVTRSAAGTYLLDSDAYGNTQIQVTVDDWPFYIDNGNLVVNPDYYSLSGSNAVINSTYTITDGDMYFADANLQKVVITYYRWDL